MFYEIDKESAESYSTLNAIVVPRPIGWISTLSEQGRPQPGALLLLQRRRIQPPAGHVRRDQQPQLRRAQGRRRSTRRRRGSSSSTSPRGSCGSR